jgi:hypothetical protein
MAADQRSVKSAAPTYPFYDVKMTRYGLLFLAMSTILLNGCGSAPPEPPPAAERAEAQPPQPDEMHCRAVARERADDTLANGYGFNIEESVYQETYSECMAWRTRDSLK